MSRRQHQVITEEFGRRRAGALAGIGMAVGPAILRLGTDEQKAAFLPGMAAGEIMWAEGYTEPNAGSDLASLKTTAVKDGDEWVINGTKTYCTAGHHCNWIIIAARTEPDPALRHRAISYFLSPTDVPETRDAPHVQPGRRPPEPGRARGVRVSEHRTCWARSTKGWNEVWFGMGGNPVPRYDDDDPGPEIDYEPPLVGPGVGARPARAVLPGHRCGRRADQSRTRWCASSSPSSTIGVEIEEMLDREGLCDYGGHLHQAITKEFQPVFGQVAMEVLGPLGLIQTGEWAPLSGEVDRIYRRSFGNHAGGTSQLKRMVVATRVLGPAEVVRWPLTSASRPNSKRASKRSAPTSPGPSPLTWSATSRPAAWATCPTCGRSWPTAAGSPWPSRASTAAPAAA